MDGLRPARILLAALALLLPFCGCHALSLLGGGGACCATLPIAAEVTTPACCHHDCCGRTIARDGSTALAPTRDAAPPAHAPRKLPGCAGDTCCVKSAPTPAPWQLPALFCLAVLGDCSATRTSTASFTLRAWPPTLPLGQPPTPLDRGTLLLV